MNSELVYTLANMSELSEYLEKTYLEWQMQYGRASVSKFASFLGINRAYLTLLMNGNRTSMSMELALQIADLQVLRRYLAQTATDLSFVHGQHSPVDRL